MADVGISNSNATLNVARNLGIKNEMFTLYCAGGIKEVSPCLTCHYCLNEIQLDQAFFISIGTIEPRKNYLKLIEEWTSQRIQENLLIVGNPGWFNNYVKKTFNLSRLNSKVTILNRICDFGIYSLIKTSNGLISASVDEGFNIPLMEARRLGTRIFSTKVAVNEELHRTISKWLHRDLENLKVVLKTSSEEVFDSKLNAQKLLEFDEVRQSQINSFLERTFAD